MHPPHLRALTTIQYIVILGFRCTLKIILCASFSKKSFHILYSVTVMFKIVLSLEMFHEPKRRKLLFSLRKKNNRIVTRPKSLVHFIKSSHKLVKDCMQPAETAAYLSLCTIISSYLYDVSHQPTMIGLRATLFSKICLRHTLKVSYT